MRKKIISSLAFLLATTTLTLAMGDDGSRERQQHFLTFTRGTAFSEQEQVEIGDLLSRFRITSVSSGVSRILAMERGPLALPRDEGIRAQAVGGTADDYDGQVVARYLANLGIAAPTQSQNDAVERLMRIGHAAFTQVELGVAERLQAIHPPFTAA